MNEYIKALEGISFDEWKKLREGMDSYFAQKRSELDKNIKLTNGAETISTIIRSRFGQTSD